MPTYYVMVGIPGSGKSTFAKKLRHQRVCPDAYREKYHASDAIAFGASMLDVEHALRGGNDVIFDATNTIRLYRRNVVAVGRAYADRVICLWMDTPIEECLRRHAYRQQRGEKPTLTSAVIERMQQQLTADPPLLEDGFDEIRRIVPPTPGS